MATASTKTKNVNTGGKRGHNTNQGNPMFMTPAKPVMKKDKKTDPELESESVSQQGALAMQSVPLNPPYSHHFTMPIPIPIPQPSFQQNASGTEEEIITMKPMFTSIMAKLDKLDSIEITMNNLSISVQQIRSESAEVKQEVNAVKNELTEIKTKNKQLEERIIDMQCRSMRENLIFYKIREEENEELSTEDILKKFIMDEMKVEEEMLFERVHRMGRSKKAQDGTIIPRPIIAKFSYFKQKERVRKAGFNLKGSMFGVSEQFPQEIIEQRKRLMPKFKKAKQEGRRAKLVVNKLYMDGKHVTTEDC